MSDEPNKLVDQAPPESDAPAVVEDQDAPSTEEVEAEQTEVSPVGVAVEETTAEVEVAAEVEVDDAEEVDEAVDVDVDVEAEDEAEDEDEEGSSEESGDSADDDTAKDDTVKMDWYILKVQSNRERSISDALRRKIAIEGLDEYFGEVVVPMEKVTEFKGGKKKVVQRKLYPGYIVVNMQINDDTWFAVRETAGIGDFTGASGKPTPMLPHEVARIIQSEEEETDEAPKLNITFKIGDRVKIKEGTFESFEGEVNAIDEHSGRVTVMINIFGRSTPVELEYWQAEQI